jgi:3-keto-L-gulonate-6-phosphate decarboxylase
MDLYYHCPNPVERNRVRDFVKQISTLLDSKARKADEQQIIVHRSRDKRELGIRANAYREISKLLLEINITSSEP